MGNQDEFDELALWQVDTSIFCAVDYRRVMQLKEEDIDKTKYPKSKGFEIRISYLFGTDKKVYYMMIEGDPVPFFITEELFMEYVKRPALAIKMAYTTYHIRYDFRDEPDGYEEVE